MLHTVTPAVRFGEGKLEHLRRRRYAIADGNGDLEALAAVPHVERVMQLDLVLCQTGRPQHLQRLATQLIQLLPQGVEPQLC